MNQKFRDLLDKAISGMVEETMTGAVEDFVKRESSTHDAIRSACDRAVEEYPNVVRNYIGDAAYRKAVALMTEEPTKAQGGA